MRRYSRTKAAVVILAGAAAAFGAFVIPVATAQTSPPSATISPTSGPIGTTITITVTNCQPPGQESGEARADFSFGNASNSTGPGTTPIDSTFFTPSSNGSATTTVTAEDSPPGDARNTPGRTDGSVLVQQCANGDTGFIPFTVTRGSPSTTTTTVPPTTTTTTTPPTTQTIGTITPAVLAPGQAGTIAGIGFAANALVNPVFHSDPVDLGTIRADGSGNFSATVTIPASAAPGSHQIVVSGPGANGGTNNSVISLTVAAQSPVAQAVTATANFTG